MLKISRYHEKTKQIKSIINKKYNLLGQQHQTLFDNN